MNRSKNYYRHHRERVINRKTNIVRFVYREEDWAKRISCKLSKNKIHCSCYICRFDGPSHSDMKKLAKYKYDIKE